MGDEKPTSSPEEQRFIVRIEVFAGYGRPTDEDVEVSRHPILGYREIEGILTPVPVPGGAPLRRKNGIVSVDFFEWPDRSLAILSSYGSLLSVTPAIAKDALLTEAKKRWDGEHPLNEGAHWLPWGMRLERWVKRRLRQLLHRVANSSRLDERWVSADTREHFFSTLENMWRPPPPYFPPEEIAAVREHVLVTLNERGGATEGQIRERFPDVAWWVVHRAVWVGLEEGLWHFDPNGWEGHQQLLRPGPWREAGAVGAPILPG